MSSFLCLCPAFGSHCPPSCQSLFFSMGSCCLGTGLGVPQFVSGPDQSLGRNFHRGWMWGHDLGRRVWLFIILPLSWVSLPTCVILEFACFPQKRFQLAFDVTSKIFMEDQPTLLYSECCMYSKSECKLHLSRSIHLLLSIRAALKIHTTHEALYCHYEGAKCQFRVRSW